MSALAVGLGAEFPVCLGHSLVKGPATVPGAVLTPPSALEVLATPVMLTDRQHLSEILSDSFHT